MEIKWLNQLGNYNSSEIGEKTVLISQLTSMSSRFIIPQGFVLPVPVINSFLKENHLEEKINNIIESCNLNDFDDLKNKYNQIKDLILNSRFNKNTESKIIETYKQIGISEEIRKYGEAIDMVRGQRDNQFVSVRASPTKGINVYKTILNVAGKEKLINSIKECISSFYSPEALIYREKLKQETGLAILIQRMISPEKSACVFTSNPLGSVSEIVVEAAWGIGSSLSQGIVSPDQYKIDKNSGQLIEEKINLKDWMYSIDKFSNEIIKEKVPPELKNRSVLTTKELGKIVEAALLIESKFNVPCKICFSINRGKLILFGIERISNQETVSQTNLRENVLLTGLGASAGSCNGIAKVLYDPREIPLLDNNVLVTITPFPDFLAAAGKITGMITDEGSMSCKLATVFREFGIPMVVATKNATELLNSTEVSINGLTGEICERSGDSFYEEPSKEGLITGTAIRTLGIQKINGSDGAVVLEDISFEDIKNIAFNYGSESVWIKRKEAYSPYGAYNYENYIPYESLPDNVEFILDFSDLGTRIKRSHGIVLKDFATLMQLEDYINTLNFVLIDIDSLSKSFGQSLEHPAVVNSIKKVSELCNKRTELAVMLNSVNSRLIEKLIEIGIDSLVVYPEDFNKVKEIVARKERKFILKKLRKL